MAAGSKRWWKKALSQKGKRVYCGYIYGRDLLQISNAREAGLAAECWDALESEGVELTEGVSCVLMMKLANCRGSTGTYVEKELVGAHRREREAIEF